MVNHSVYYLLYSNKYEDDALILTDESDEIITLRYKENIKIYPFLSL